MEKTALILGANGRFGRHAKHAFEAAGWQVATYRRGTSMVEASRGMDVIINGLNPAYPDWTRDLPLITRDVIEAARNAGASVFIPGNVYNYGDNPNMPWSEKTPHAASTKKGKLRIEMEATYAASDVQTIVLRGGDFIDVQPSGNWYENHMAPKLGAGKFMYPGPRDRAHSWCYLPDLARATEMLMARCGELSQYEDIQFPGYTLTGDELISLLERQLGRKIAVSTMPWWFIRATAPFWALGRELLEMRYIWEVPHALDGTRFAEILPGFQDTDPGEAFTALLKRDVDPDKAMIRADGLVRPA